jgi:hypothetical protein
MLRMLASLAVGAGLAAVAAVAPPPLPQPAPVDTPTYPAGHVRICGNAAELDGPVTAPQGAVRVPAGDNARVNFGRAVTYWFAPGTHTLGGGRYDQIDPVSGATFVGAPGAVLDGQHANLYAFGGHASHVTISNLTISGFGKPGDNQDEGVVNHDSGTFWTLAHSTVTDSAGAGFFLGSDNVVDHSCLAGNGQYGFSMYSPKPGALHNLVIRSSEIASNNQDDWESRQDGCGCDGGGKFWDAHHVRFTHNWVHDNRSVGLWADTDDADFLIARNWFSANDDEAIIYEVSYNANISDNVFVNNAIVEGRQFAAQHDNFPVGAIYLSESGYDGRVGHALSGRYLKVSGNRFTDNWGGVVAWENADRFCNSPANSSSGYCTLVGPRLRSCSSPNITERPLYENCRWRTQHIRVTDNLFQHDPASAALGGCSKTYCGHQALLSNYGTYPSWSPYKGFRISKAITFDQDNRWSGNTYEGTWRFVPHDTSRLLTLAQWRAAPYNQDGP